MITVEEVLLLQQLADETAKMRELQNTYFRNRTQYNLTNAKNAEGNVDDILTKLSNLRRSAQ